MLYDYLILGLGVSGLSSLRYLKRTEPKANLLVADTRDKPPFLEIVREEFPELELRLKVEWNSELFNQAAKIIVSPGIDTNQEPFLSYERKAVFSSDLELFKQVAAAPIIGITGSNGKSTVTTLAGEIIEAAGFKVAVGGNLGVAALDLLLKNPNYYVLELSSFQLETVTNLPLEVAIFLNFSPDHEDRYHHLPAYLEAKKRIFQFAKAAIVCLDEPETYKGIKPDRLITFGVNHRADYRVFDNAIFHRGVKILAGEALKIRGEHNLLNVAAILAMNEILNLPLETTLQKIVEFSGLAHRCQFIMKKNGVTWYNDSKGTNLGATIAALKGMGQDKNTILILGGIGKNADFSKISPFLDKYVRVLIVYGRDGDLIVKQISYKGKLLRANSLAEVVTLAKANSLPNDQVLFSPACASMDMFKNFEERGEQFMKLVLES